MKSVKNLFEAVKNLFEPIKKHKTRYVIYIMISMFNGAIWPIQALIISKLISSIEQKNMVDLQLYAIIFLGILVLIYSTMYIMRTQKRITRRIFQESVYKKYLKKYLTADNNQIELLGTGQANSILQRGFEYWNNIVNGICFESTIRILTLFTAITIIIWNNLGFKILIICLGIFSLMFGISRRGNILMKPIRKEKKEIFIQMDRSVIKIIMSKFEILQNTKIIHEINTISNHIKQLTQLDIKESKGYIIGSDISKLIIDCTKWGFMIWYGTKVFYGEAEFSQFTLIWMLLNQFSGLLYEASDVLINYNDQIIHVKKLQETLENIPKIKGYDEGNTFMYKKGDISIKEISFAYKDEHIIDKLSLTITGGQKTAIVGKSGTGKSTLLKLLSGYIHPNTGTIEIDNQDIKKTALKTYYHNIGYLSQDPSVFDGTVLENLLYGTKSEPTEKEIKRAIEGAQCQFIYEFKEQLETQIGEKGVRLSGGQKQRLAIAKLLLKDPKIIFLDEPTSALDSFSEESITKALNNLFKGRTVIVAAHRLQTVKKADHIIVLGEHGQIIEQGTHEELIKERGSYYKMIELQSGF